MLKNREYSIEMIDNLQCNIRIEELIRYIDFFSAKYNQSRNENENCKLTIQSLSAELERINKEKNDLKQQNTNYSKTIDELTHENDQLKETIEIINNENDSLRINNNHMSEYIWELISTCDTFSSSNELQMPVTKEASNSDVDTMSDYIWELIEINDKSQKELDLLKKAYGKQKMQISYLQSQTERYQRTISSVTNKWYGKIALKFYNFIRKIGLIK